MKLLGDVNDVDDVLEAPLQAVVVNLGTPYPDAALAERTVDSAMAVLISPC